MATHHLDDPARIEQIRATIQSKPALRRWFEDAYGRYRACLARCPPDGIALELGSGGGFAKEAVPGILRRICWPTRASPPRHAAAGWAAGWAARLDGALMRVSPELGSFVDVELERVAP